MPKMEKMEKCNRQIFSAGLGSPVRKTETLEALNLLSLVTYLNINMEYTNPTTFGLSVYNKTCRQDEIGKKFVV